MRPLYQSVPALLYLFRAVYALWLLPEAYYFLRSVGRRPGGSAQDRLSGPALIVALVVAVTLGSSLADSVPQAAINWERPWLFGLGLAIAVAGIVVRCYAVRSLGRFFTVRVTTSFDQVVVDTGPYRYVRHPSYTGALMTVFGVLLCATNWLSLLCFVIALPGFAYRIAVEEAALTETLGDSYRDYMRRTKRLIPLIV